MTFTIWELVLDIDLKLLRIVRYQCIKQKKPVALAYEDNRKNERP
jgi:hypothetical protein